MNKKLVLAALIFLTMLTLASCAPRVTTKTLSSAKGEAYAAKVDDIVENLIIGFSENDYAKYTRDMDESYIEQFEASLQEIGEVISSEFGAYQGKTLDHVETRALKRVVIYHLVFDNEPDVLLEVYFYIYNSHLIVGTYWDSQ